MTGCDTTSRLFGVGKMSAINKFQDLVEPASVFLMTEQTQSEIEKQGELALEKLYGAKSGLNFERAARFSSKVATRSTYLPPEVLPPTSDAARFHSHRVYHQVQAWNGNVLDPTDWGWLKTKTLGIDTLKPVKMQKSPAPESLLKLIKCNCKGNCERNTCSCRKHGLLCTLACGQCKGITCANSGTETEDDE